MNDDQSEIESDLLSLTEVRFLMPTTLKRRYKALARRHGIHLYHAMAIGMLLSAPKIELMDTETLIESFGDGLRQRITEREKEDRRKKRIERHLEIRKRRDEKLLKSG